MTKEEAIKFWKFRYENAKDYTDPHWEAQERREHREYVEALRVAIEALKAEPKCVAQIKVDTEEIVRRIKEEYDITYDWIPCSERLPKEKQEVYVTVYFTEGDTGRAYGYIDGFGEWHLCSAVEGTLNSGYEVIAWMPLPTPYGERKEP